MSSGPLKAKKDRRQTPNRRAKSRNGRRAVDVDHTTTRYPCPQCGEDTVAAVFEDRSKGYACQTCGKKW
jgi:predicted RNA-binding Zn-ribbon protein involved in translation (DUF1610 family)